MVFLDLYVGVPGSTEFKDENFKKKKVINIAKAVERSKNIRANIISI